MFVHETIKIIKNCVINDIKLHNVMHTRAEQYYRLSNISWYYANIDIVIFVSNYRDRALQVTLLM